MSHIEIIGDATLYLGDAREILWDLEESKKLVDVLITDPPYGVNLGTADRRGGRHGLAKEAYGAYRDTEENFKKEIAPIVSHALRMAHRGAVFCNHNLHYFPKPDAIGGVYLPSGQGRHSWGFNCLSPISFYGVAPRLNHGSRPSVLKSTESAEQNGHPCPKPIGWMRWLVDHASSEDEIIIDPFMGSATTGVAAIELGRKFIGIEIEPKYFKIAVTRLERAIRQTNLFKPQKPKQEAMDI